MKDEHRMAIFRHREVLTYRASNLTEKVLFTVVQLIVGKKKAFFSLAYFLFHLGLCENDASHV